ncbi:hypothetical protein K9F62_09330 [Desulfovibrio sp. JY]|nr:hypothetical protein K9F62_09330 [Desulfovibrio sp. JY]
MTERTKTAQGLALIAACLLGVGLGWLGATYKAVHEGRARDNEPMDTLRARIEAEEMRLLDLNPSQRATFIAAREQAHREMAQVFGRNRPELEYIMRQSDARIRPMLSPRQLAVYDRLEQERRRGLPERPDGADD